MGKHHHKHRSKDGEVISPKRIPLSLMELLEEKVDEDKLLRGVELSEDDLFGSTIKQPELYWMAGRLYVQVIHKKARLELELDGIRSKIGLGLRDKRDDKGKRKYDTEGWIKAQVETNSKVQKIRKQLARAAKMEAACKQLLDTYRMRESMIRVVTLAGKISLHLQELELLRTNRKLAKAVMRIRQNWKNPADNNDDE